MPRFVTLLVLFLVIFSASMCCCSEARKLQLRENREIKVVDPSPKSSLFSSSLPKGTVPASTPSKKGHAMEVDEKLIARNLISVERVLLTCVPSPGAGH
ncbi:precursor of CEP14-like [Arachis duranensis]|uniref:Precursor of CEP14-like n=1 Tax=Arachis duranensis TaxID=130453 RepID=A0A6P4BTE2_ARADU|nr:precursor of CEP14-like [Arachis duranensis]